MKKYSVIEISLSVVVMFGCIYGFIYHYNLYQLEKTPKVRKKVVKSYVKVEKDSVEKIEWSKGTRELYGVTTTRLMNIFLGKIDENIKNGYVSKAQEEISDAYNWLEKSKKHISNSLFIILSNQLEQRENDLKEFIASQNIK